VVNQDANIDIKAGTKPGYSIVLINVQRRKCWTAGMSIDDSGLQNTAGYRLPVSSLYILPDLMIFLAIAIQGCEKDDALKGSKEY